MTNTDSHGNSLDKPCPEHHTGTHKWGFKPNSMYCGNCGVVIPLARLICEHCGGETKFLREDIVSDFGETADRFECSKCGKVSPVIYTEVQ